jgi:hypothetical protein
MQRYDTKIDDGILYIEWEDDWLEVGSMAAIEELLGGDTYEIEYDETQSKVPWLEDSLDEKTLTFDVTETILDMDFNQEFVQEVAEEPIDETRSEGQSARTDTFAEKMRDIFEAQGREDDE